MSISEKELQNSFPRVFGFLNNIESEFFHKVAINECLKNTFNRLKYREEYTSTNNKKFRSLFEVNEIINYFNNWNYSSSSICSLKQFIKKTA